MTTAENIFTSRARLPSLDGWRALAITLVLGAHCRYSNGFPPQWDNLFGRLFDGNLGVRFFFVISGYLISLLMLRERARGHFSLRRFWVRRALRILPVYVMFLLVLKVLTTFTEFRMTSSSWIGAVTFTANYVHDDIFLIGHLWSLSVEEQFYVVWPILFGILGSRTSLLLATAAAVSIISVAARIFGNSNPGAILLGWQSLLTNMDSLAVGCTLAYLTFHQGQRVIQLQYPTLIMAIGVLLLLTPRILIAWKVLPLYISALQPLLQAIGFGILMVLSIVRTTEWWTAWLQWRPVAWVGTLSYSIYIWQQIFCARAEVFGFNSIWFLRFPIWIVPVLLCAAASFYAIEMPALRLKQRLPN